MAQLSSVENSTSSRHRLLFAGVAAATVMGVSLGLWARPAMSERQQTAPAPALAPEPALGARSLQIVIDDTPAPLGAPIEVLPATAAPAMILPPQERFGPEPQAPMRPASGLMRVKTIEPSEPREPAPRAAARPVVKTVAKATETPRAFVKSKAVVMAKVAAKGRPARLEPPRFKEVKTVQKARPKVATIHVAKAEAKPANTARPKIQLARVERHVKPARIEKAAVRLALHRAQPAPKVQKAMVEYKMLKPVPKPRVVKVAVKLKPARSAGPPRLASPPRPEPTLRDADRQMSRAYSTARAAGVPDWKLQRQQQRWEQARASAAREAPWAVHDVYLARIAELHDLTRTASDPGY